MSSNFKSEIPRRSLALVSLVLGILTSAAEVKAASTPATNAPSGLDFSTFKIITDRNIFNPRRSGGSKPRTETRRSTPRVDSFALVGVMSYDKGPFAFFEGTRSEYRKTLKPDDTIAGYKVATIESASVKLVSSTNEVELPVGMQMSWEEGGSWSLSARVESTSSGSERSDSQRSSSRRSYTYTTSSGNAPSISLPDDAIQMIERKAASDSETGTTFTLPDGGEARIMVLDGNAPIIFGESLAGNGSTNANPGAVPGGSDNDVLRRLMQRREQENNR